MWNKTATIKNRFCCKTLTDWFSREAEEEIEEKKLDYDNPDLDLDTKRTNFYKVNNVTLEKVFYLANTMIPLYWLYDGLNWFWCHFSLSIAQVTNKLELSRVVDTKLESFPETYLLNFLANEIIIYCSTWHTLFHLDFVTNQKEDRSTQTWVFRVRVAHCNHSSNW